MADPYRLATPEQVEVAYDIGGLGSRFVASLIDALIFSLLWLVLLIGVIGGAALVAALIGEGEDLSDWIGVVAVALFLLGSFVLFWGYYVFFEVVWSGQSPGKRVMGLRVVTSDGQPIGFLAALVRNVVRLVDFLPFYYLLGASVMLLNRRSRRLGDFAAGTIVIRERRDINLRALATPLSAPPAESAPAAPGPTDALDWSGLTPEDYILAREFLLRRPTLSAARRRELAGRIAAGLATKLRVPAPDDAEAFLERVAIEYRRR